MSLSQSAKSSEKTQQALELKPVTVIGAEDGTLELKEYEDGVQIYLDPYEQMKANDGIYLEWTSNKGHVYKPYGVSISRDMVGKRVLLKVERTEAFKSSDSTVEVICRIEQSTGGELRTKPLKFKVALVPLP